jgi:pentalenene oxygenase
VFFGDGLATVADGETHLRNRRLMQPTFNKAHIATRGEAMITQVREMVAAWPEDQPGDVYADMNDITLAASSSPCSARTSRRGCGPSSPP